MSAAVHSQNRAASIYFILVVTVLGLAARAFLLPIDSSDQQSFLIPWFDKINELGPAGALKDGLGDYMPPYFWIMIIVNALPISNKIYGLKFVSCFADLIAAVFIMKIVKKLTGSDTKAELSFAAAFMLPSALVDSAAWGQCDSIYTLFLIMCVYFLISGRDFAAVTCFSVSFVFKLQAVFLAPLIVIMVMKKKIRLRTLVMIPAVYVAAILPSALCGRSLFSLFTLYFSQAAQYNKLNMTLPNIWSIARDIKIDQVGMAGVIFAEACCLIVIYYLWRRDQTPGKRGTVLLAAMSALFVPYLLPYMHERYYYPATLISLLIVFIDKRLAPLWFVVEYASATSMMSYLFDMNMYDARFIAFFITAALVLMFVYYCRLNGRDEPIGYVPAETASAAVPAEAVMQDTKQENSPKGD